MTEMERIKANWLQQRKEHAEKEMEKYEPAIAAFIEHCNTAGYEISEETITYIETIGVVAKITDLLKMLCPELQIDKDGLYDLNELRNLYKPIQFPRVGMFLTDHFAILAHPFFRRGMSEHQNWAPRFIELLWRAEIKTTQIRIALDPDRLRINLTGNDLIELDTWFGPSFNQNIAAIKDELVQIRPPATLDQVDLKLFFGSAYSLHIKWATAGNIKTFQAEAYLLENELIEWRDEIWHPVRYIHAEFDLTIGSFRHFDGAIHFYTTAQYKTMRDADLNYNLKYATQIKAPSVKLFRIDGDIPVQSWITLTGQFFLHNPLIIEYFEKDYPPHIKELIAKLESEQVPKQPIL